MDSSEHKRLRYLVPFFCALLASPAFIVLHELGHYAAGACLGLGGTFHYAGVNMAIPEERLTRSADFIHASAGPLVNAALAVSGLLWLYRLRRDRRDAPPVLKDWLATTLVLCAGRWTGLAPTRLGDEKHLSQIFGVPVWVFPTVLGLFALFAFTLMFRLHPRGRRLFPFLAAGAGGMIGLLLWLKLLGPFVLP